MGASLVDDCRRGWAPISMIKFVPVSLTLGIVGLPNVGKSTLFNALTRSDVLAANYPFATIDPNIGLVELPDARLTRLAEIFSSERILPATVSFVDIAGIVKGASHGEGRCNAFLDIDTINTELILADLQTIEKALPRLEKEARKNKELADTVAATKTAQTILEDGRTLYSAARSGEIDLALVRDLHLMTAKPFLYVFNSDEAVLTDEAKKQELRDLVAPADCVFLDAKTEAELLELDDDEAQELLESIGQTEPGLHSLAKAGFHTLGLQTYLTAGPKEARAWTIHQGDTAPKAAGVIHTDFEQAFIKAEIVSFDDLDAAGSMAAARAAGKVRQEGKEYVMADGDVVEFKSGRASGGKKK